MKFMVLFLLICLALCLVSSIESQPEKRQVNRPKIGIFGPRQKRSPQGLFKGGVKVHPLYQFTTTPKPTLPTVRKGEYICGNKICKLKPGVVPEGCHGICQYPIL